jgi:hypothetical protein
MAIEVRVGGGWLTLVGPGVAGERRGLDAAAVAQLGGFTESYRALLGKGEAQTQLLALGRQLYGWLDGEEHWLQRVRAARPLLLELRAPVQPDAKRVGGAACALGAAGRRTGFSGAGRRVELLPGAAAGRVFGGARATGLAPGVDVHGRGAARAGRARPRGRRVRDSRGSR